MEWNPGRLGATYASPQTSLFKQPNYKIIFPCSKVFFHWCYPTQIEANDFSEAVCSHSPPTTWSICLLVLAAQGALFSITVLYSLRLTRSSPRKYEYCWVYCARWEKLDNAVVGVSVSTKTRTFFHWLVQLKLDTTLIVPGGELRFHTLLCLYCKPRCNNLFMLIWRSGRRVLPAVICQYPQFDVRCSEIKPHNLLLFPFQFQTATDDPKTSGKYILFVKQFPRRWNQWQLCQRVSVVGKEMWKLRMP